LLLDFERPMRWPGRLAWRAVRVLLRVSPFVRDARRNQQDWERRADVVSDAPPYEVAALLG